MLVHAFLALRAAQTDCQIPLRIIRLLVGRVCEMVGQQQEARAAASGMCFGKKPFQSFILFCGFNVVDLRSNDGKQLLPQLNICGESLAADDRLPFLCCQQRHRTSQTYLVFHR